MTLPPIIQPALLDFIRGQYRLDWAGTHGYGHWVRVCENGLRLAALTGADAEVAALFAFTHDMAREHEGYDTRHGPRAAEMLPGMQGVYFDLSQKQLKQLAAAVRGHTGGRFHADITVRTCWDADRLDIGRIGVRPNPLFLCTPAARDPELIEWAVARSQDGARPDADA